MKALATKLNNWLLSVYARLLDYAQETGWWKGHLKQKDNEFWKTQVESMRTLFSEDDLKIWGSVIENQVHNLRLEFAARGQFVPFKAEWQLKCAVKAMRELNGLRKIVSVQPMQGPVGLVYHMRYNLSDGSVNTGSPFDSTDVQTGEMPAVQTMRLEVVKKTAEAKSRKLQACWNIEAAHDLTTIHGISMEAELTSVIGSEVAYEVFNEVIDNLYDLGKENTTVVDVADIELPFVRDLAVLTIININRAATRIADRTRRGAGNFIIASPQTIALLQTSPKSSFVANSSEDDSHDDWNTLRFVGILNHSIKVYASTHKELQNNIIVGYKGGSGELDTGYIYSPYIVFMSAGAVMNPVTFSPEMKIMTRYGKTMCAPSNLDRSKANDYYGVVDITEVNKLMNEMMSSPDAVDKPNTDSVQ